MQYCFFGRATIAHGHAVRSRKPCPILCLFRWLKSSFNLERSFTPYTSCTERMEFDFILMNGDISPLTSLYESIFFKSGSRPFHIVMQQVRIKTIPYCNAAREKSWLKNFASGEWFFNMFLTWWSRWFGKIYIGCQVGWRKTIWYFEEKKVISETIFYPRAILGLVLHIYSPYLSLG